MNEPADKPLHDWVRQTLRAYQPAYEPQAWKGMQRRLRRRRGWRRAAVGSAVLIMLLTISWFAQPTSTAPEADRTASPPKPPVAGRHPLTTPATEPINAPRQSIQAVRPAPPATVQPASVPTVRTVLPDEIRPIPPHSQLAALPTGGTRPIRQPSIVTFSPEESALEHQLLTGDFGPDSTSYQALTRNLRRWPDAVVVADLTSSMYPYSTQLFAWFRQNTGDATVKGLIFFTDCDSLGRQTRAGGPAGRMFVTRQRDAAGVLPLLIQAARNTVHNDDDAENDVEALLFAQQTFPEAKHLILLADNMSSVKDIDRLGGVTKPVHVVLCGTTGSDPAQPFQPDHYTIASRTNGSLHTMEDDLNPAAIPRHAMLHVGTHYYRYGARKGQFRLTSFTRRPIRLFGFLWL